MACKSMTGFGRGEVASGGRVWMAELRCVNNRYLDLKIKIPQGYAALEEQVRKKVSAFHQRGRVDLLLAMSGDSSDLVKMHVNMELVRAYKHAMEQIARELGREAIPDLAFVASRPEVLVQQQQGEDMEAVWPHLEQALDQALVACETMRQQEGAALVRDLSARLQVFTLTIEKIQAGIPELLRQREQVLGERLQKLLGNVQLDEQRLCQEVAILADKTDVTEEIVRLQSHIGQFQSFLTEKEAVGRKLDFLLQEFLREVNTIASKINDAAVAYLAVELKSELEKMREQIQNIE
ncbi:MAG: YicC family protein [Proteobacteria bacterium]|nr:YicC family protein [Pseudomonadota bacterium]MBU1649578.1 YicC family protein [Pseudomonadota bacterium]